jgi:hypothetical protein
MPTKFRLEAGFGDPDKCLHVERAIHFVCLPIAGSAMDECLRVVADVQLDGLGQLRRLCGAANIGRIDDGARA